MKENYGSLFLCQNQRSGSIGCNIEPPFINQSHKCLFTYPYPPTGNTISYISPHHSWSDFLTLILCPYGSIDYSFTSIPKAFVKDKANLDDLHLDLN